MYENVNKLHPYIEKELEGIETYDRVILYGKAGRSVAIERPFILDEPITTGNMSEYEVKEIRPLLFQITNGGNKWLVGSKNFPRPDRGLRTSKGNRLVTIQVGHKFSTVLFWKSRKLVKKEEIGDLNAALYMAAHFLRKPVYQHLFVVCP